MDPMVLFHLREVLAAHGVPADEYTDETLEAAAFPAWVQCATEGPPRRRFAVTADRPAVVFWREPGAGSREPAGRTLRNLRLENQGMIDMSYSLATFNSGKLQGRAALKPVAPQVIPFGRPLWPTGILSVPDFTVVWCELGEATWFRNPGAFVEASVYFVEATRREDRAQATEDARRV